MHPLFRNGGLGLSDRDNVVDRRRSLRHNLRMPLGLQLWGGVGPNGNGKSVDISEDGALIETDLPLRVGSLLDLRIELPGEITGQQTTEWRCKGRVVRIVHPASVAHPVRVGVHFDWLSISRK
ncbi:MAG: hypothetical protein DMG39_13080 [Acidobacteria bacterium]|nr:MAG: hypothetical protein DMG39_13080 [Acidobacteriota bacterium]